LYRYYDIDGNLLYVGVSVNSVQRMINHRSEAHWFSEVARIEIENHEDRQMALRAETLLVTYLKPKYNILKQGCARVQDERDIVMNMLALDSAAMACDRPEIYLDIMAGGSKQT
jgi:predicted GIY-YIG superfamily endonuclease